MKPLSKLLTKDERKKLHRLLKVAGDPSYLTSIPYEGILEEVWIHYSGPTFWIQIGKHATFYCLPKKARAYLQILLQAPEVVVDAMRTKFAGLAQTDPAYAKPGAWYQLSKGREEIHGGERVVPCYVRDLSS